MKFTKMHGIGNDYIYIDCFSESVENPAELSKRLSDRHFGIGGDGLILVMPSEMADVRMRMFNSDGSEGLMCGNGIRCVGKFAYDRALVTNADITVETASGVKRLSMEAENGKIVTATVDMGEPKLAPVDIPMIFDGESFINRPVSVNGVSLSATAISMGNPHWVFFMEEIDCLDLRSIGPAYEFFPLFPSRVNTEFAQIIGENTIKMRVWERGSGETLACGTGACAVAVAARLNGLAGRESLVKLPGGDLLVKWAEDGHVYMTGTASEVFTGEIAI